MNSPAHNLILILGPTASGKTRLAARLAADLNSEIISVDSRQVYRSMNIGTGKDLDEYTINHKKIPYHLIDVVDAGEKYHVDRFKKDFFDAFKNITNQNKMPIACGGTGLYFDAVLKNYAFTAVPVNNLLRNELLLKSHKELQEFFEKMAVTKFHAVADLSTHKRCIRAIEIANWLTENKNFVAEVFPILKPIVFGIATDVAVRRARIEERLNNRLQNGMIEEVQSLLEKGIAAEQLEWYGLEYKFISFYLNNKMDYHTMQQQLLTAIQQFAKRQMTYFRKMERDGLSIFWLDAMAGTNEIITQIKTIASVNG